MGRAGSGGGGRSSGGGHSSGRSGGGHSVSRSSSSSRRAGSGSFGGGSRGGSFGGPSRGPAGRGPGMPSPHAPGRGPGMPPPPPRGRRRVGGYYRGGGCVTTMFLFTFIIVVLMAVGMKSCAVGSVGRVSNTFTSNSQSSTIVREKLDTGNAYINDCVIDELGWFDSVSKTASKLKEFWEETGVQPYIILKAYDAGLDSDSAKEQWAIDYYDENFDTENIFLFVYFAEEDTDNDVGYMAYANGYQTSAVMDSEAIEIFWNYIDKYWYTNLSTDDVFINAFNDTANTIMHVSTTGKDIVKWALIVVAIVAAGIIIISLVNKKHKRAREKAEEDQRILNTPINDIAKDDLENKYL